MLKNIEKLPALGVIELDSIASGYVVSDVMVKKAPVTLVLSEAISSGKYLVMISGEVEEVKESLKIGREVAGHHLVDDLFIPQLHLQVSSSLSGKNGSKKNLESLGIIETKTVASTILASDTAVKTSNVQLIDLKLGKGIGGKGYFVVAGELADVQAAHDAALKSIDEKGTLFRSEVVTSTHNDVRDLCT